MAGPEVPAQVIDVHRRSAASADELWALVGDVTTWSTWGSWSSTALESPGPDGREGVGAVRRLVRGRVVSREEITAYEPSRRLAYRLLSGLPLHDYDAWVALTPDGEGCEVRWHAEFDADRRGTGWFWRAFLHAFIAGTVRALSRYAERHPGSSQPVSPSGGR